MRLTIQPKLYSKINNDKSMKTQKDTLTPYNNVVFRGNNEINSTQEKKIPNEELMKQIYNDKDFFNYEYIWSNSYKRCFVAYPKDYISPSLEHQVIQVIEKTLL